MTAPGLSVETITDARIDMNNNTVDRTIRPIALNRKSPLFAGYDAGAANWAAITSLVETCRFNPSSRTPI